MSFGNLFKKIGTALGVIEHTAGPIIGALYPPAAPFLAKLDNVVQTLHASVIATEANNPADGQGGIKSVAVNADLNAYMDTLNSGLAFANKHIQDDAALRQAAIDATVAGYNATSKWKASWKVVDLPPAQ